MTSVSTSAGVKTLEACSAAHSGHSLVTRALAMSEYLTINLCLETHVINTWQERRRCRRWCRDRISQLQLSRRWISKRQHCQRQWQQRLQHQRKSTPHQCRSYHRPYDKVSEPLLTSSPAMMSSSIVRTDGLTHGACSSLRS